MATTAQILGPVVGLNLWTLVIEGWMYATRIPAVQKANLQMKPDMTSAQFNAAMPPDVRWKADNYNNLMEQPLQFYAISLVLAQLGTGTQTDVNIAWAYVGVRVVHSLVQCLTNRIPIRFAVFLVSSGVLTAFTVRTAMSIFG
ncbi:hypothetical protein H072_1900 [Dactylellina haptotyla CBS 200.50]|uniref:Uncharacterized protein n=1 Tax=Dactylellina haptotyla (strain CBS 200.50) TaxID=1284197 RepID=S8AMJ9_DACHA|nr:hypothetical protein H072_1900 [Dactylellina haptotyla CBS 200.50]